jgi:3D (Asp-Asp-Asp) domain-containing protein
MKFSKDLALAALAIALFIGAHAAVDALDRHDAEKVVEKEAPVYVVERPTETKVIKAVVEVPTEPVTEPATEEVIPEADEDEKIQTALIDKAVEVGETKITHYCICKKCCGKSPDHPAYGITASGKKATPYVTVAVDPKLIPLGSDVLVDYGDGVIQTYIAQDTGSGVNGSHIDLCVEDHQTAINLGVKTAKVWFIAPEDKE